MDYRYKNMKLLDFVKTLTIYRGLTLRKLLKRLHEEKGYSNSYSGFYNKLKTQTLRFSEICDIAEFLEYDIVLQDTRSFSQK